MPVTARKVGPSGEAFMSTQTLVHPVLDGQTGAAFVAASPQNLPSATGRHACSEAMGPAPLDPTRLIGPFHADILGRPRRVLPCPSA
jgi:hypothetical protein